MKRCIAVLCSDIHLSHTPPIARSSEPSWYAAMRRVLTQVRVVVEENEQEPYDSPPLIIAGDIFHRWNSPSSPAELISFAIDEFKKFPGRVFSIPGQHDLPAHRYEEMHRSAYGTLSKSGAVSDIPRGDIFDLPILRIHSFPWGTEVKPVIVKEDDDPTVDLAVIHEYVWIEGCTYPGADSGKAASKTVKKLEGFDAAVFGDNHKGFQEGKIFNCGALIRRNIDEISYRPRVGLLWNDGTITPEFLDTTQDIFIDRPDFLEIDEELLDFTDYIEEMREMGVNSLDFVEELTRRMEKLKVGEQVQALVHKSLEAK